jgi:hypothetical protein
MKNIFPAAAALLMSAPFALAAPAPARVPADLVMAESSGPHRLLVFQACSDEHCWNQFFVQELALSPNRRVLCSAALSELNKDEDAVARSARWRPGPWPVLELELKSEHDVFVPYVAVLAFKGGCKYQLQPASPPAASR